MKRDLEFTADRAAVSEWWRAAPLHAIVLAVTAILLAFWQTAQSIVAIWIRSDTFAHGFVVVPLCVWLAWGKRDELAAMTARPWWWGLAIVFSAGALWLVATAADVQVIAQFSLAFMLQAAIVTIVGLRVAAVLAFPLAFLLFAVPTGEFLMPTLVDRTADFTVAALRFSGIPVYREANNFIIPSGAWSVVEACSGIRYLIASIMVGTIYAATAYRSLRQRILFMVASILVPIVANWIRAYLIVLIGHLSNNRLASGVDHLIYGWLFFGVVMLLLFWIGSFWQERDAAPRPAAGSGPIGAPAAAHANPALYAAAVASIITALVWQPLDAFASRGVATATPILAPIANERGWVSSPVPLADWKPRYAGYRDDVQQTFDKGGAKVGLYIAYYRNQTKGRELVTSMNRLVKRGDWEWNQIASGSERLSWEGREIAVDRVELSGRKGKLAVYRLYWIAGHLTANDYVAKALLAWSKLTGGGDDSALIAIYVPPDGSINGDHELPGRFTSEMSQAIDRALALTRGGGR